MDHIDQRLLESIAENARKPVREIADEAGISREVADYRIKKLEKNIIRGYQARINLSKFTYSAHLMLVQLKVRFTFLNFLRKYPQWMVGASGKWDALLFLPLNQQSQLHNLILDASRAGLRRHSLMTVIRELSESFPGQGATNFSGREDTAAVGESRLDEQDRVILRALCRDAKATNRDIASLAGLSAEAVRYRINRLEEDEYILGYRAVLDYSAMEVERHLLLLELARVTPEIEDFLKKSVSSKASQAHLTAGRYSFSAVVHGSLVEILTELKQELGEDLVSFEAIPVAGTEQPSLDGLI